MQIRRCVGWSEYDPTEANFKRLTFLLSIILTMPQIYQTTLITLTFVALASHQVSRELKMRRSPLHVLLLALLMLVSIPVTLPMLVLATIFRPSHLGVEPQDYLLVLIGLLDFGSHESSSESQLSSHRCDQSQSARCCSACSASDCCAFTARIRGHLLGGQRRLHPRQHSRGPGVRKLR